jgi:predicted Zn-dependent protease
MIPGDTNMPGDKPTKIAARRKLSPREAEELDVEIGFLEGLVRRDPEYVDALQILGDDYTRRGRFAEGLEVDQRLSALRPEDALVHYNLACSLALTRDPEAAVKALHRALDLGYRDFRWLRRDPDLRGLRRHPLFKSVRERMRQLEGREELF